MGVMHMVNKIISFFLLFVALLNLCACSDDSSSGSSVNGSDGGGSSADISINPESSAAVVDTFVEYVEPPALSCERVEGLQFESSLKPDTSYYIESFGFYGDDLIAIPRHPNNYGLYGHENDPAIDTFYVKKNESTSWQKLAAFKHYLYEQEGNKLCIVGKKLALIRTGGFAPDEGRELCRSEDARNWTCDPIEGDIYRDFWLTCDDKYFYKSEYDNLYYSEDATNWTTIDFHFSDGIHSVYTAFANDTAHFVVVTYNAPKDSKWSWQIALLHSKDMVSWDTSFVMGPVAFSLARLGEVYVLNAGWGGSGSLYYSKDLRNWTQASLKSNEVIHGSMVVSNGILVVVGARGHVYASRNGKDFKVQEACGSKEDYVSVIADSKGNIYALRGGQSGGPYSGKYDILRVVE